MVASDGGQRHAAAALDRPIVILLHPDGPGQADYGRLVGKDPTTSVRRLISALARSIALI
jgi:hypothetical protein